jgi:zinc protease
MVTLVIKAGNINESKDKAGLANLVAELLTEGTKNRTSKEISEEVDFIGASLNASAGADYTTITLSVLKKDLQKGFEIFSEILLNPVFPENEVLRKKDMIKGFLKHLEEDPSFVANRALKKEIFGEHPYGRILEGSVDTIDTIQREDLSTFYSHYFMPNNSILSVVGNLSHDELNNLIENHLDGWKNVNISPCDVSHPLLKKPEKKVIKTDKDLTQANIVLGTLGVSRNNPDYYALSVMNYILGGGGFSSRLTQSIRDGMGLAYDVHSFLTANKEGGGFQIGVQTKNESANTVIDEILKQLKHIREEYVSDKELQEAKSYLTGSFKRRLDTSRKIADFLAITEYFGLGTDYVEKYPLYINAINKDDILKVAQKYLSPEDFVLVVVANQNKAKLK